MKFYLGTHEPRWLWQADVPLFVSAIRLREVVRLRPARLPWALDSGGFSELAKHGRWTVGPEQYVEEVRRWAAEIGGLEWAACQDWMCEPEVRLKTGLSVSAHQGRTVENYLRLRELAPDLPWAPVLQGWTPGEYMDHADAYEAAGVRLADLPRVGIGSVCRRQGTMRALFTIGDLAERGIRLHGFGFKVDGLLGDARLGGRLVSADSLAWSFAARRRRARPGCDHASCANCLAFALEWREDLLDKRRATGGGPWVSL